MGIAGIARKWFFLFPFRGLKTWKNLIFSNFGLSHPQSHLSRSFTGSPGAQLMTFTWWIVGFPKKNILMGTMMTSWIWLTIERLIKLSWDELSVNFPLLVEWSFKQTFNHRRLRKRMKSLLGKKWTHISFLGRAPATVQALLTWLLMIDCCRGRGKLSNQGFFRKDSPTSAASCTLHPGFNKRQGLYVVETTSMWVGSWILTGAWLLHPELRKTLHWKSCICEERKPSLTATPRFHLTQRRHTGILSAFDKSLAASCWATSSAIPHLFHPETAPFSPQMQKPTLAAPRSAVSFSMSTHTTVLSQAATRLPCLVQGGIMLMLPKLGYQLLLPITSTKNVWQIFDSGILVGIQVKSQIWFCPTPLCPNGLKV